MAYGGVNYDNIGNILGSVLGAGGQSAQSSLEGSLMGNDKAFAAYDSVMADVSKALAEGGSLDPSKAGGLGNLLGGGQGARHVANPNMGVQNPSGMMFTGGRPYPVNHYAAAIQGIGGLVGEVYKMVMQIYGASI